MSRANLDKQPHEVAAMFDDLAKHYDRTDTVISLGLDRHWRAVTRKVLDLAPGQKVLDVAAGTAISTLTLARSGAWCVAADFSQGMLRRGADREVPKVAADALALPFADGVFDAVTVSFGLRNMSDTLAALAEMLRVVRPGGRLVVC
jgi:demethylmenaquinone methyltransferase / 2-methoxy-6-polyprenyl-1,4-benzoquinol methylase